MDQEIEEIKENVIEARLLELKKYYPQFFDKQGQFQIDKFEEFIGQVGGNLNREGFTLNFLGKEYAKLQEDVPTNTLITPDVKTNFNDNNKDSENIYIVGDNLSALKHLRKSYSESIKLIYIDPPYNTGKGDFTYPDKFEFTKEKLADILGDEDKAERIFELQGKSSHSAWLTFMLPRISIAYKLLKKDGVMLFSIDENEYANLKLLCDDIFGEMNKLPTFIWQNKKGGGNDSTHVAEETEYILAYARDISELPPLFEVYSSEYLKRYKEEDDIGRYYWDTFKRKSGKQYYPITAPDGTVLEYDENGNKISWLRSEKRFYSDLEIGDVKFVNHNGKWNVHFKQRLPKGKKPRNLLVLTENGTNSDGSDEILNYFGAEVFTNPKPSSLIKYFIEVLTRNEDIVLDFFSGSGTTADAVFQVNADTNGDRKFILVQLPEPTKDNSNARNLGYKTIDEIGRERIRKAAEKVLNNIKTHVDLGFKTYYAHERPVLALDEIEEFSNSEEVQDSLGISIENNVEKYAYLDASGRDTLLTTWMLNDGEGLGIEPKEIKFFDYVGFKRGNRLYLIDEGFNSNNVAELLRQIDSKILVLSNVTVFAHSMSFEVRHELNIALRTRTGISLEVRY
ncbi:site-specific DNA-methyltransferase [Lysinibacillus capsici]|uniref:site-specific DNA-methyltransferase n=1 Tax=Lysinibacillus capsici TaxID=2115968 RepID=UPI002FDED7B4